MAWLLARLKEPSTHAGVAVLLAAAAQFFPQYATIIWSVAGFFGFTAMGVTEKSGS